MDWTRQRRLGVDGQFSGLGRRRASRSAATCFTSAICLAVTATINKPLRITITVTATSTLSRERAPGRRTLLDEIGFLLAEPRVLPGRWQGQQIPQRTRRPEPARRWLQQDVLKDCQLGVPIRKRALRRRLARLAAARSRCSGR